MIFHTKMFCYRINKIADWNQENGLTMLVHDQMDLRYDLTEVHFDVATTESSNPSIRNKPVNPLNLPSGYRVDKKIFIIMNHKSYCSI